MSQEEAGENLILGILHGDSASAAPYLEEESRPRLNLETLKIIQSQINWLSRFIGDALEQFMTGTRIDSTGKVKAFFREYRLASESNKRSPLILIHVWFKDSTTNEASGIFVKTFLDASEKRIANEQTWEINGKPIDVNAIVMVNAKTGSLLAIEVFDDDTTKMDTALALRKGVPIIRKAIAEGFLEKVKQAAPGGILMEDIGVAFLRKEPHFGFAKVKYGFKAKDYESKPDTAKRSSPARKGGSEKVQRAP
jgi:hypothetical protein